jgi:hypothetical protein
MTATSPTKISAAAERMRRHRQRRRDGLRSLTIELRETEIDALIRAGLLGEQSRNDANAVIRALYRLFDRVFDSMTRNVREDMVISIRQPIPPHPSLIA